MLRTVSRQMARFEGETSNRLFAVLTDWNEVLQRTMGAYRRLPMEGV
jgi:hypothetical protein